MELLYIDESGSMNNITDKDKNYFVITVLHVKNKNSLKNSFNRFIRKNKEKLKSLPNGNKMFDGDKFKEIKGSALTPDIKKEFLNYICINNSFKVFYVIIHNNFLKESLLKNKEVGFNFILEKLLTYKIKNNFLPRDTNYHIHLDNRNLRTGMRDTLRSSLIRTLIIEDELIEELELTYHDSEKVKFIQVADFFANLLYSNLMTNNYNEVLNQKVREGYISHEYNFPYNRED